jgi:hypothetical protein
MLQNFDYKRIKSDYRSLLAIDLSHMKGGTKKDKRTSQSDRFCNFVCSESQKERQ